MSVYRIPEKVLPGFKILNDLNFDDLEHVLSALKEYNVGDNLESFQERFKNMTFTVQPDLLAQTIISFGSLLRLNNNNIQGLAEDLSGSYNLQVEISGEEKKNLEEKLRLIFELSGPLTETLKAYELMMENDILYHQSRIFTDIRPVFKDEIGTDDIEFAVLMHRLKIEYLKNGKNRTIELTLDLEDIKNLEEQVNRAKEKERKIRDGKNIFKYIQIKK